ncbi:hypothetical protein EW145_g1357 [Phellinidium pouzarii]|uniref:Glycosyltransferase family 15 protein n=1 Tax=Phellinidium pouzarii TaxID=167371 RepID=A0A4S4LEU2_9AGAM|nr:hypothetical protein EW145_g1357 [Phellinidium pouzarii]
MGSPFSPTQSVRVLASLRYLIPALILLVTLHYIRSFSLSGSFGTSTVNWHSSASERLAKPLGEASTSDLVDLLSDRLGNTSLSEADIKPVRANAVIVMLVRNSEVNDAAGAIKQLEDRFNAKYNYPWVFLNDEPFDENFIQRTSQLVSGNISFGVIPHDHWVQPDWIDENRARDGRNRLMAQNVIYGGSISYRNMCRFNSGFFYRHELLQPYRYYWRVEPGVKYFCDMNYDPFLMMQEQKKVYSFTISLYEWQQTIPTLWSTVKEFIKEFPQYLAENNAMDYLSNDGGNTFNLCHFWSNFEIADMDFWRGEAYSAFFDYLEKKGGFYYERWGDAPVHSIAAALFANKDQIHFFRDIGYRHDPFQRCPQGDYHSQGKCWCDPTDNFDYRPNSCVQRFEDVQAGRI